MRCPLEHAAAAAAAAAAKKKKKPAANIGRPSGRWARACVRVEAKGRAHARTRALRRAADSGQRPNSAYMLGRFCAHIWRVLRRRRRTVNQHIAVNCHCFVARHSNCWSLRARALELGGAILELKKRARKHEINCATSLRRYVCVFYAHTHRVANERRPPLATANLSPPPPRICARARTRQVNNSECSSSLLQVRARLACDQIIRPAVHYRALARTRALVAKQLPFCMRALAKFYFLQNLQRARAPDAGRRRTHATRSASLGANLRARRRRDNAPLVII